MRANRQMVMKVAKGRLTYNDEKEQTVWLSNGNCIELGLGGDAIGVMYF